MSLRDDLSLVQQRRYTALAGLSDEVVMSHLAAGNHDALAVIFDRYQRLVIRVAMQILRDAGEAEDAMQSVFIAILENARKFDAARGSLRVWILQHAYHQAEPPPLSQPARHVRHVAWRRAGCRQLKFVERYADA